MAASVNYENGSYHLKAEKLVGTTLYLKERSVTGTENILMAAIRAEGTTTLYHAAEERHISNLANLLRQYGFQITGDGTSTIVIHGKPHHLGGQAEIDTIPDEIEVGTFVVAAAITGGTVSLERVGKRIDLLPILAIMDDFNVQYTYDEANEVLNVLPSPELKATNFKTGPWPGFPTDLQSPFTILATQATGTSLIHDWMFEDRLYFVRTLHSMGASIVICDPHRILVTGPTPLTHSSLVTPDLRAGAAFVLAALAGEGTTIVEHSEMIDRGYANLDERLRSLGADIVRID
jgi:UDP-N-acetylglucosamine 1-carboxyvinyltransferase